MPPEQGSTHTPFAASSARPLCCGVILATGVHVDWFRARPRRYGALAMATAIWGVRTMPTWRPTPAVAVLLEPRALLDVLSNT